MGGWDGGVARWAAPISQKKNAMGSQPPVAAATATSPPAVPVARLPTDGINVVEVGPAYVGRRPRTALFGAAMRPRGALLHPPRPPPPTPRLFDQPHQPTARHTGDDARRRCESPSSRDEKKAPFSHPCCAAVCGSTPRRAGGRGRGGAGGRAARARRAAAGATLSTAQRVVGGRGGAAAARVPAWRAWSRPQGGGFGRVHRDGGVAPRLVSVSLCEGPSSTPLANVQCRPAG